MAGDKLWRLTDSGDKDLSEASSPAVVPFQKFVSVGGTEKKGYRNWSRVDAVLPLRHQTSDIQNSVPELPLARLS